MQTGFPLESSSIDMPQLPEVVIDGHKVAGGSQDALSEVYELINTANLARMRKLMADQAAIGWVKPYNNLIILPAGEIIKLDSLGQAISVINDGPAAMQLGINSRYHLVTINVNQAFNLNFRNHTLDWFYVQCGPGLTATARIVVIG